MKIHKKLFLIFFIFSLLLVTALVLLMQWSIGKGMIDYVNSKEVESLAPVITSLSEEYQKQDSWDGLQGEHHKFEQILFLSLKNSGFDIPPPMRFTPPSKDTMIPHRPPLGIVDYVLFDHEKNFIAGNYDQLVEYNKNAIKVNGRNVGWLAIPRRHKITDGYELEFLEQQQSYLWIIALVTMMLAILITLPLAHHLIGAIKQIMLGMNKLTQGNYQSRIEIDRKDELGELALDFNRLASTLHENEAARKRWLANISHELRTPVAILRGELEAMLDDVRPMSKQNILSASDEVKHLQSLIDDLHQLTSADIGGMHYHKKNEDLACWINAELSKYKGYLADADIKFETNIDVLPSKVFADMTRLCQLFDNIINNCIKYSEASLVNMSLVVDNASAQPLVRIKIEDDGVGVTEAHLPHLFEHLYRVENSRNRETGGSGLGLSICEHIVNAHQGKIFAERSNLGGLAVIVELPLKNNS